MKRLKDFFADRPEQTFKKGEVLLHQDETGSDVHYLIDGYVKAYTISDDGDEKLITILGPSDILNLEAALYKNHTHSYYYEALTDGKTQILEATKLEAEINEHPGALMGLVRYLMNRNDELAQTLNNILQAKADTKLVTMLAFLVQRFGREIKPNIMVLPFPLSHAQLASMVGTTRETMTVQIGELTKAGVIKPARSGIFRTKTGSIEINLTKLRELTDI